MKSIITVTCPECDGVLEIDVSRQRVLSHKLKVDVDAPEKDKAEMFDDVLNRVRKKQGSGDKLFDAARKEIEGREDKLDDLFGEVKKRVAEEKEKGDPDEDPRDLFWD